MMMLTIEQLSYLLKFALQKMKQPGVSILLPPPPQRVHAKKWSLGQEFNFSHSTSRFMNKACFTFFLVLYKFKCFCIWKLSSFVPDVNICTLKFYLSSASVQHGVILISMCRWAVTEPTFAVIASHGRTPTCQLVVRIQLPLSLSFRIILACHLALSMQLLRRERLLIG